LNPSSLDGSMRAMADVRIEHVFNCSVDTYWDKVFFDEEYNRRLFTEALGFPVWKEVSRDDKGNEVRRTVEVVPKLGDLPGPIKKLIGDGVGYREEGVFDKQSKRYKLKIFPNKLGDKMTIAGEIRCEPSGDAKCKRIYTANVEARVFGVGGMLEKRLIADMEKGYDVGAKFTNDYLAEKKI
jgi:hypothetical protein